MERVLNDLNNQICVIYLNDILIWSSFMEEHLKKLEAVFQHLLEVGLKLKPSKCKFFEDKIGYLGNVVSSRGAETDPSKIKAVTTWETPKNVNDVRSFLGFTRYYCRFVKDYAVIAKPLTDSLGEPKKHGKNKRKCQTTTPKFVWGEEQQQAFDTFKQTLTTAPILAYPDYSFPFIVHTNASREGLGAVLYQDFDRLE